MGVPMNDLLFKDFPFSLSIIEYALKKNVLYSVVLFIFIFCRTNISEKEKRSPTC